MFDLDAQWRLHSQVAVRPEPFGALLYHFGTRKLSFLKDRKVVGIVGTLSQHTSARGALEAAGVESVGRYADALEVLARSSMLERVP